MCDPLIGFSFWLLVFTLVQPPWNPHSNFPSHSCFLRWKNNAFWGDGAWRRQKLWRKEGGEWSMFWCEGDMPHTVATAVLVPTWVCFDIQYLSYTNFLSEFEWEIALLGVPHGQEAAWTELPEVLVERRPNRCPKNKPPLLPAWNSGTSKFPRSWKLVCSNNSTIETTSQARDQMECREG